jgi:Zn-dependent protease with chaperone function
LSWRIRLAVEVLRAGLLAGLGLTPLGARFIHVVAPDGNIWKAAAAWLVILVALAATRLPTVWWLQQARRVNPDMMRPSGKPAERLIQATVLAGLVLISVLMLVGLYIDFHGNPVEALAIIVACIGAVRVLVRTRLRINRKLPSSDRLTAVLATLPGEPGPAGQPAVEIAEGWIRQAANIVVLPRKRPLIVVAPPVAAALTDRQLRAVLAHEVAHVLHGDQIRVRVRGAVMGMCAMAIVIALDYIPALRSLAGLHGRMTVESVPFLLAFGYLAFRVLYAVSLVFARAAERQADRGMVKLTGDADACIEAMTALFTMTGAPESAPPLRRLLFATHPSAGERLRFLRRAAGLSGAPLVAQAGDGPG